MIDLGPGAGSRGGQRPLRRARRAPSRASKDSATGELLRRRSARGRGARAAASGSQARPRPRPAASSPFRRAEGAITIVGARAAQPAEPDRPRSRSGGSSRVSGVSGSGKSTLVRDILHNAYARRVKGAAPFDVGAHDRIDGLEGVADLLLVDQSPLGRSARSNPVTYTKAWDEIRQLFARSARAVSRGITARDFSFNSVGRPLRGLPGTGWQTIDMQFLADVTVRCDVCDGRRFQPRVLAVRLRGKNIDDVLDMTVEDAAAFFAGGREDRAPPRAAASRSGLGYVAARPADGDALGRRGAAPEARVVPRDPAGRRRAARSSSSTSRRRASTPATSTGCSRRCGA